MPFQVIRTTHKKRNPRQNHIENSKKDTCIDPDPAAQPATALRSIFVHLPTHE
jgi:hypothetical protein